MTWASSGNSILMKGFVCVSSCGGRQNKQETLAKGLKLHARYHARRTTLSETWKRSWALIWLLNINYISWQSEWWMLHERTTLSRQEASLRPERERRSRDLLGTDSVRSKLPPQYVPVSPSPVSHEASRDLWRLNAASTMVVFKLRTSMWMRSLCPRI